MSTIAKESGTNFKPVPAGTHFGRCYGVVDLGTQPSGNSKFEPSHKVLLLWELPDEVYEYEGKQIPSTISKEYTLSIGKKANLRKHLDSWRGRPFTEEEASGFPVENVIGAACTLSISHQKKQSDGSVYAKIESVSGLPRNMKVADQNHSSVHYVLEMGRNGVFESLPEWIRKKINACLEWNESSTQEPVAAPAAAHQEEEVEEDVPFALCPPWLPFAATAAAGFMV